jgi:hypothetical protein
VQLTEEAPPRRKTYGDEKRRQWEPPRRQFDATKGKKSYGNKSKQSKKVW